jgi:small subunit ribosomal protein S20
LPSTRSAAKRMRQSEKRQLRNRVYRSQARTFVKRTWRLIEEGDMEGAQAAAQQAIRALDKAAQKGVIHKNNAARRKSRLVKRLNQALQAQANM